MRYVELKDGGLLVVKDLPIECMKIDDDGRMTAIISDESIDSDGDIIRQGKNKKGGGWDLARYNAAPVITWMHNMYDPSLSGPETRAKLAKVDGRGKVLMLDPIQFDLEDPKAAVIDGKLKRKSVREWSVGFKGRIAEPLRQDSGDRAGGYEFFEQELIETAVVNRGANFNTSTALKSLIAHVDVADIEDAGDAETIELKGEIEMLAEQVKRLEAMVVASLVAPDDSPGQPDETVLLNEVNDKRAEVLAGILQRLSEKGIAHE